MDGQIDRQTGGQIDTLVTLSSYAGLCVAAALSQLPSMRHTGSFSDESHHKSCLLGHTLLSRTTPDDMVL